MLPKYIALLSKGVTITLYFVQVNSMSNPETFSAPTIIVAGGGGGAPRIAKGIAETIPEARIVLAEATHDGGGSSGRLRNALGIPAVGDIGSGIAAFTTPEIADVLTHRYGPQNEGEVLSEDEMLQSFHNDGDKLMSLVTAEGSQVDAAWAAMQIDDTEVLGRKLIANGDTLKGHTYRNLLLANLTRHHGIGTAIKNASFMLGLPDNHIVMPWSTTGHKLVLHADGGTIVGEGKIDVADIQDIDSATVELTDAPINPELQEEFTRANVFVDAPGSWFTSKAPFYKVDGVPTAIATMPQDSPVVTVANLSKQTKDAKDWGLETFIDKTNELLASEELPEGIAPRTVDAVIFNNAPLPEGVKPIIHDADELGLLKRVRVAIGENLVDEAPKVKPASDSVERSEVFHKTRAIGEAIAKHLLGAQISASISENARNAA